MEEPPEEQFQPDFLHRLETFEVVLLSNGPTLPHEKQERNRNIMECHWQDDLEQSVMEKLAVFQDRLYDIKKKVEVGNGNLDEVAQAATLLLGQLAALPVSLIQEVYVSSFSSLTFVKLIISSSQQFTTFCKTFWQVSLCGISI